MSVIGSLLVSGLGGLSVLAGIRRLLTAISLHRSHTVPGRDIATEEGTVEFEGRVEPSIEEEAFEAPFSGEETVCCQVWMQTTDRHRTDTEGLQVGTHQMEPEDYENTESALQLAETGEIRRSFVVTDGGARVVVDPDEADLDITDHMGETVLTVESGDSLSTDVCDRLASLDGLDVEFDTDPETWDRESDRVTYREARLAPGTPVHISGGVVEDIPDEWGTGITATVGAPDSNARFMISEGTESSVIRKHLIQFTTGITVGLLFLTLGLHVLGVSVLP